MPLCGSVYLCLVVTYWGRASLLALVCGVILWVCYFSIGILSQVWYLIVSIPDLCIVTYLDLKRVLAYPFTSSPLTFAHIDGLKIFTDKSTLTFFSNLEMRIITDAHRNVDFCIVNGMFLIQNHVDLVSTFCGKANVTLSCLVRRAHLVDFACDSYKYPSINDIYIER